MPLEITRRLMRGFAYYQYYGFSDGERVVRAAVFHRTVTWPSMADFYVDPQWRRLGFGTAMLRRVLDDWRGTGLEIMIQPPKDGPMSPEMLEAWYLGNGATSAESGSWVYWRPDPPCKAVLVACSKQKAPGTWEAQDLYSSNWFKAARMYAEAFGDRWGILSARHGLVWPRSYVRPYDETLTEDNVAAWGGMVLPMIRAAFTPGSEITVLAGATYRYPLLDGADPLTKEYTVRVPLKGMGIGAQTGHMRRAVLDKIP